MITLNAKINLDYDKAVAVQSAQSNIADTKGNYDLSYILNIVSPTAYVGAVASQRNGLFYEQFDALQKTFWQKADRQTYSPQGKVYYNDTLCLSFRLAYFADFSYGLPYASQVTFHEVAFKNQWQNQVYYEYTNTTQKPIGVGISVDVYIPMDFANSGVISEPTEAFPEVLVYGTAIREKGDIGKVYEITVTTDKPTTSLEIVFDQANNYHPTRVEIDGATFPVNKAVFSTDSLPFGDKHTIKIYDWNNPKSYLFIYGISSHLIDWTDIDYRVLTNCEVGIFDRGDTNKPNWGIYSNGGTLSFNDVHGIVEYFADNQLLTSGIPVDFFIKNTLTGKTQKVGKMYTSKWDYDSDNRTVNVAVKDDLEEWQDINVDGVRYNPKYPRALNLRYFYSYLHINTPSKYHMSSFYNLDETTQDILTNTYIKYPLLESGNLWQQWNKICKVAQGHIFKNTDGITMFVYNGGN